MPKSFDWLPHVYHTIPTNHNGTHAIGLIVNDTLICPALYVVAGKTLAELIKNANDSFNRCVEAMRENQGDEGSLHIIGFGKRHLDQCVVENIDGFYMVVASCSVQRGMSVSEYEGQGFIRKLLNSDGTLIEEDEWNPGALKH